MADGIPPAEQPPGHTEWDGAAYQKQFDDLAATGAEVHGETDLIMKLCPESVLDVGCGTGRVAAELQRRGVLVVGIDRDRSMITTARTLAPDVEFMVVDAADADLGRTFDLVAMAGNVPLFTPEGTQDALLAGCARHLAAGGRLVAGFQLGRGYTIETYDQHCSMAGLVLHDRWSSWDQGEFTPDSEYAVSVHRRTA